MVRGTYLLLGSASLLAASAAFAQDAPPPPPANANGVQDIIVTAQRRAENVINVPLSIQAITGQSLKEHNIQKFDQLNFTTSGFVVQSGTGYTEAFIRGVGNPSSSAPTPASRSISTTSRTSTAASSPTSPMSSASRC